MIQIQLIEPLNFWLFNRRFLLPFSMIVLVIIQIVIRYVGRQKLTNVEFEGENISPEKLPQPSGWRILVGMLKIEEATESGIVLPKEHREGQEYLRSMAKVLAVGELAYQHDKFQGGVSLEKRKPKPWVNVGDIVLVGQYAGQSINVIDSSNDNRPQTLKLLNDDEILAVIPDISVINT